MRITYGDRVVQLAVPIYINESTLPESHSMKELSIQKNKLKLLNWVHAYFSGGNLTILEEIDLAGLEVLIFDVHSSEIYLVVLCFHQCY